MFRYILTASSSKDVGTVEDQMLLSAMPLFDNREYTRWSFGCYDARLFLEMAVDSGSLSFYIRFEYAICPSCD